ncbi:MAG: S-methyl-5'-thioadenosine phosphorylase [Kiritimatiellaeota bacterium]|nr:S-methyl-5'-thioadenosine phosphorylase [Kiritimatiellota bacterium]
MALGFIGGSGLYKLESELSNVEHVDVETPFGSPSDKYVVGTKNGVEVVFLPRHGVGHRILPSELNHKANIYGMKKLGVTHIVSLSACGSLRENMKPRDFVVVEQYVDRTKREGGEHTFFGNGIVAHISFADPVCPELSEALYNVASSVAAKSAPGITVHQGGTYLNMEGPAFSTKAESNLYRSWGMDVIGMTNIAEAKLAREAGICYATLAMVTDYDCWHGDHESVTLEMILGNLSANTGLALKIAETMVEKMAALRRKCSCATALATAVITDLSLVPEKVKNDLAIILP